MAGRIQGITVEIGGDTTKLQTALKGVNTEIRNTQSQLRDVDKLLKLDSGNTELLAQKHRLLGDAVKETKEKLETLKTAAELAAAILTVYNIPLSNLLRHGDITTKCCPAPLMPASRGGSEGTGNNWTWEKFKNRVAELMGEAVTITYETMTLSRGSQGDDVKDLQEGLILLGYSCGKSGADGDFGRDTEKAVRSFQADRKLTVDGSAGTETLGVFRKLHAVAIVQNWLNSLDGAGLTVDGGYGPKTKKALVTLLQRCLVNMYGANIKIDGDFGPETKAACRAVAKGDKGLLVSILQAGLLVHGITYTKIDASFGDATERGVIEFQEKVGITVDGDAGSETFEQLMK